MTDYVVGDIQGCLSGLQTLLAKANFDPRHDKLWAVGDLIARGPQSLQTLDYLYNLGDSFDTVLGNHDLHLLAIYCGYQAAAIDDNLDQLIGSADLIKFVNWIRRKPLVRRIDQDILLTHAGLYPRWSLDEAEALSREVSEQLVGDNWQVLIKNMYSNSPSRWSNELKGISRWRFIINAFTRMRFITKDQQLELNCKMAPKKAPAAITPWFKVPNKKLKPTQRILFGHWAALNGATESAQFIGLDTGYIWGGSMTLYNLTTGQTISTT